MPRTPHLASASAACCWIPLFALRCEAARRSEPGSPPQPGALFSTELPRRLWQVSPLARHAGVKPGMMVSQAIGLCAALKLYEPDPVHYDEQFARLLAALARVSPVVETAELGLAYVGTDGLEGLYGGPEQIVEAIKAAVSRLGGWADSDIADSNRLSAHPPIRLGWGRGKFVSWVAATRARPGEAVIIPPSGEAEFLASQPVAVLPLDPDAHRRLRQLGLRTLRPLAALPEEAIVSQFGRAGRRWWRLAAGATAGPGVGRAPPQPLSAPLTLFTPVADPGMLVLAPEPPVERAPRRPRPTGGRVPAGRAPG